MSVTARLSSSTLLLFLCIIFISQVSALVIIPDRAITNRLTTISFDISSAGARTFFVPLSATGSTDCTAATDAKSSVVKNDKTTQVTISTPGIYQLCYKDFGSSIYILYGIMFKVSDVIISPIQSRVGVFRPFTVLGLVTIKAGDTLGFVPRVASPTMNPLTKIFDAISEPCSVLNSPSRASSVVTLDATGTASTSFNSTGDFSMCLKAASSGSSDWVAYNLGIVTIVSPLVATPSMLTSPPTSTTPTMLQGQTLQITVGNAFVGDRVFWVLSSQGNCASATAANSVVITMYTCPSAATNAGATSCGQMQFTPSVGGAYFMCLLDAASSNDKVFTSFKSVVLTATPVAIIPPTARTGLKTNFVVTGLPSFSSVLLTSNNNCDGAGSSGAVSLPSTQTFEFRATKGLLHSLCVHTPEMQSGLFVMLSATTVMVIDATPYPRAVRTQTTQEIYFETLGIGEQISLVSGTSTTVSCSDPNAQKQPISLQKYSSTDPTRASWASALIFLRDSSPYQLCHRASPTDGWVMHVKGWVASSLQIVTPTRGHTLVPSTFVFPGTVPGDSVFFVPISGTVTNGQPDILSACPAGPPAGTPAAVVLDGDTKGTFTFPVAGVFKLCYRARFVIDFVQYPMITVTITDIPISPGAISLTSDLSLSGITSTFTFNSAYTGSSVWMVRGVLDCSVANTGAQIAKDACMPTTIVNTDDVRLPSAGTLTFFKAGIYSLCYKDSDAASYTMFSNSKIVVTGVTPVPSTTRSGFRTSINHVNAKNGDTVQLLRGVTNCNDAGTSSGLDRSAVVTLNCNPVCRAVYILPTPGTYFLCLQPVGSTAWTFWDLAVVQVMDIVFSPTSVFTSMTNSLQFSNAVSLEKVAFVPIGSDCSSVVANNAITLSSSVTADFTFSAPGIYQLCAMPTSETSLFTLFPNSKLTVVDVTVNPTFAWTRVRVNFEFTNAIPGDHVMLVNSDSCSGITDDIAPTASDSSSASIQLLSSGRYYVCYRPSSRSTYFRFPRSYVDVHATAIVPFALRFQPADKLIGFWSATDIDPRATSTVFIPIPQTSAAYTLYDFTIEGWVQSFGCPSSRVGGCIIATLGNGAFSFGLQPADGAQSHRLIFNAVGTTTLNSGWIDSEWNIGLCKWTHLAFRYSAFDPSVAASFVADSSVNHPKGLNLDLFINGIIRKTFTNVVFNTVNNPLGPHGQNMLQGSATIGNAFPVKSSTVLSSDVISATHSHPSVPGTLAANRWSGSLDEFRIWQEARTEASLLDWYAVPLPVSNVHEWKNLVGYYQFDEGVGDRALDTSLEDIHALFVGFEASTQAWSAGDVAILPDNPGAPDVIPPIPIVNTVGATSVTLSWTGVKVRHVLDPIVQYAVLTRRVDAPRTFTYDAGTIVSQSPSLPAGKFNATVNNLLPGVSYEFRLIGISNVGCSSMGPGAAATTKSVAPSSAPLNLQIVASDVCSVAFSWNPPTNNELKPTGYRVWLRPTQGPTVTTFDAAVASVLSAQVDVTGLFDQSKISVTIDKLKRNTRYSIQVQAVTNTYGSLTPEGTITGNTLAVGVSSAPSAPVLKIALATSITLFWPAPDDNGGNAVTSYNVYMRVASSTLGNFNFKSVPILLDDSGSGMYQYEWTGLTSGVAVEFKVQAVTAAGFGDISSSSGPLTPDQSLFVSDFRAGMVYKLTKNGQLVQSAMKGFLWPLAIPKPEGVVVDIARDTVYISTSDPNYSGARLTPQETGTQAAETVFQATSIGGKILKYKASSGAFIGIFISSIRGGARSLSLDPTGSFLYVTSYYDNCILKYRLSDGSTVGGTIASSCFTQDLLDIRLKVTSGSAAASNAPTAAYPLVRPMAAAVLPSPYQVYLWVVSEDGDIASYNRSSGYQTGFSSSRYTFSYSNVLSDPAGKWMYLVTQNPQSCAGQALLKLFAVDMTFEAWLVDNSLSYPRAIAYDSVGDQIYVSDDTGIKIYSRITGSQGGTIKFGNDISSLFIV